MLYSSTANYFSIYLIYNQGTLTYVKLAFEEDIINMELSPRIYNWFVRPSWFMDLFISNTFKNEFNFDNKKVLDFGCGIGSSSLTFHPNNYLGIDCDPRRIHYARNLYSDHDFSVVNNHNLPVSESSIDYILVISVLHHIPREDLPLYLIEFRRVLKPDGKILINEPCFFENCTFSNLYMKFLDRGKYIQSEDGYVELFQKHDYRVKIHNRYNQLYCYNKLFFSVTPIS